MNRTISREQWKDFCKQFSHLNYHRYTRLQTLDNAGSRLEETGLPLEGIDLDMKDADGPCLEIMLIDPSQNSRFTHTVQHVHRLVSKVGPDGRDEVLEIEAIDDTRTLLHLRDLVELPG